MIQSARIPTINPRKQRLEALNKLSFKQTPFKTSSKQDDFRPSPPNKPFYKNKTAIATILAALTLLPLGSLSIKALSEKDPINSSTPQGITPSELVQGRRYKQLERLNNKEDFEGTVGSHPMQKSSNGTVLPNEQEAVMLYTDSLPESLRPYVHLEVLGNFPIPRDESGAPVGRYTPSDANVERKTNIAIEQGLIDPNENVVRVNSGGAHSIAAARELAKEGYLIIPHFSHKPSLRVDPYEDSAALAYFAREIADYNKHNAAQNPNAPWALITDVHETMTLRQIEDIDMLTSDIPPIPEGFGWVEITEGHGIEDSNGPSTIWTNQLDLPAELMLPLKKKIDVAYLRTLRLDPYSADFPTISD